MKKYYCFWLFFQLFYTTILAQKTYTDYNPQYKKFKKNYLIDKITYTEEFTIIFFRFAGEHAYFYGPDGEHAWFLISSDGKHIFPSLQVKNLRKNNILQVAEVVGEFYTYGSLNSSNAFTCQIYFPRINNSIEYVDLIEGKGNEHNERHFNCLKIKLKTKQDKTLGNEEIYQKTIANFNDKHHVRVSKNKPLPNDTIFSNISKTATIDEDKNNPYPIARLRQIEDVNCMNNIVLDKLKFKDDSEDFISPSEAQKQLYILVDYMKQNQNSSITIYGHTDIFGNANKNLALSKKRALKILHWLSNKGIAQNRIKIQALGGSQPIIAEGDAINRRVEFKIECF